MVERLFRDHYNIPLVASRRGRALPQASLAGVDDPERKRKIIGATFIDVFEEEAQEARRRGVPGAGHALSRRHRIAVVARRALASPSSRHHNVGGLPERMNLKLVEPLRELFKDEVRALGRELGPAASLVGRHPFPGPGLAIRIPGAVTRAKLDILRKADADLPRGDPQRRALRRDLAGFRRALAGAHGGRHGRRALLRLRLRLACRDLARRHDRRLLSLRPRVPRRVATRIINEVRGINRVVYDVTSKPPGDDRVGVVGLPRDIAG